MNIPFTPWPAELAARYRAAGYWNGQPLTAVISRHLPEQGERTAIICGERHISYRELDQRSDHLAARLTAEGMTVGDRALVQLPNIAEFYFVFLALLKIGVAPINALFSHNRLELLAYAEQIRPRLFIGSRQHALLAGDVFLQELQQVTPELKTVLLLADCDPERDLWQWLQSPRQAQQFAPSAVDQVAFFQLSGGSTGTPKLIPRTHDDYYYSVRRSADICALGPDTRYLCALPAAHNFPLSSPGALGVFHAGGTVVLAGDPSAMTCFALIQRHRVNMTSLVPPAVSLWLQAAPAYRNELASLQLLQVGGAKLPEALARRIEPELGCRLQQVFGMAEGLVNYTRLDDSDAKVMLTQGCPMSADDEVRVVDREANQLPPGQTGALLTRGPYTFRGYFQSPEHNAQVFDAEGFYRSGDLVQQDVDGYLTVVGRIKDQINRGGEKIAAEEIEGQLLRHPDILQAALVSMPDSALGEKSCAFIVCTNPSLKPLALRKYLRTQGVADFKLPDRFELIDVLPYTAVGKIDKVRLRQRIAHQLQIPA